MRAESVSSFPLVSVLMLTRNRAKEVSSCINSILAQDYPNVEIVIVDNGSTDDTPAVLQTLADDRVVLRPSKFNQGVCGGRNRALRHSRGDYLIILDDDTELLDSTLISRVVAKFCSDTSVGALAFRIVDYNTGKIDRRFFPSRTKKRDKTVEFETSWVIGAGHALTREVLNKVGYYRDFRPYGSEEYDYSLRIINAGFRIFYFPAACILHKESPKARLPPREIAALRLQQRVKAAVLNLPVVHILSIALLRSFITLIRSRFDFLVIGTAWKHTFRSLPILLKRRRPISKTAMAQIRRLNGNVYY